MQSRIGIIGGSGLYSIDDLSKIQWKSVPTPFGMPSDMLGVGTLYDREVVFLPRHGKNHTIMPSEINYRANIWAMKKLGVEWIISVSAVGSFRKDIRPKDVVLIDQFVDRTKNSTASTFFGEGIVAHINFSHPVCEELRRLIYETGQEQGEGAKLHWGGTYLNIEGPAFSTKAESTLYKSWGMDVIGMTNLYEAKLSREAEICYATMAMVTDYDSWMQDDPSTYVTVESILECLKENTKTAKKFITHVIKKMPETRSCTCKNALENTIVTNPKIISAGVRQKLDLIVGNYL